MEKGSAVYSRFSADECPASGRIIAMQNAIESHYRGGCLVQPGSITPEQSTVEWDIRRLDFNCITLLQYSSNTPCSGIWGDDEQIRPLPEEYYVLLMIHEGIDNLSSNGESILVQSGQACLLDTSFSGMFRYSGSLKKTNIYLQKEKVHSRMPYIQWLMGRSFSSEGGLGAILKSHVDALFDNLDTIIPVVDLGSITVDLALAFLEYQCMDFHIKNNTTTKLLIDIYQYILYNLHDENLGPEQIAGQFYISQRYLHKLFEPSGMSVSYYIKINRLEGSRQDLDAYPDMPITDIALNWGFCDPSHYTRCFRQHFGISPSKYRARHLTGEDFVTLIS